MDTFKMKDFQQFDEKRFTKVNIIRKSRSTAFLLNFLPNQHMKPHNHPDRELYLHVLEGAGVFHMDGEDLAVEAGDILYCGAEEQLGFTNNGDKNVSIFATMTKLAE